MGAELGFVSLSQLQKLAQSQQNYQQTAVGSSAAWMWNPNQSQEDDDSWEVRAFEEDTGNAMGTTWPPRSYTCTFCRREFRSAQALGGHMNVHRRDRARLHQTQPPPGSSINHNSSASTSSSSTFIFPSQEFSTNGGGLCLLYQLPNPNGGAFTSTAINGCAIDSPSTLLSISPYMHNTLIGQPLNFPVAPPPQAPMNNSSYCYSTAKAEQPSSASNDSSNKINNSNSKESSPVNEELDLELRLGQRSPSP